MDQPVVTRRVPETDYTIDSVVSAVRVLVALEDPPHRLSISAIARELRISRNRAFRLVKTLEAEGFLMRQGDDYAVGLRLVRLVRSAGREHALMQFAAQPLLDELTRTSGESTYLSVLNPDGETVTVIAVSESNAYVRSVPTTGGSAPFNAGAGAKILFAYQPPERRQQIAASGFVLHTPTSKDATGMAADVVQIARDHFAIALEEFHTGADSVAAPVWTANGTVVAAVGLVGPSSRIRVHLPEPLSKRVLDVARELSERLGGDPAAVPDVMLAGEQPAN
jgi:DNA-binding IclR family transcriptional regulator